MIIITILVPLMTFYFIFGTIVLSYSADDNGNLICVTVFLLAGIGVQMYLSWWRPISNPVAIYLMIMGISQILGSLFLKYENNGARLMRRGGGVGPIGRY